MVTDINTLDFSKIYTYADYLTWQFQERVELIKGRIIKMSPAPARKHQKIAVNLAGEIQQFLKRKPCEIYIAPFDVRFPTKQSNNDSTLTYTVVQPDICVVCDQSKLDDKGCNGAPDIIIEILSPSSTHNDLNIKFNLYEEHGVKEYWVVFPDVNVIEIFVLKHDGRYTLEKKYVNGDIATTDLFTGLAIDLKEIF